MCASHLVRGLSEKCLGSAKPCHVSVRADSSSPSPAPAPHLPILAAILVGQREFKEKGGGFHGAPTQVTLLSLSFQRGTEANFCANPRCCLPLVSCQVRVCVRVICCVCLWVCESLGVCGMDLRGWLKPPQAPFSAFSPKSSPCDLADLTLGSTSVWRTDEGWLNSCPHCEGYHPESFEWIMGLPVLLLPNVFIFGHLLGC